MRVNKALSLHFTACRGLLTLQTPSLLQSHCQQVMAAGGLHTLGFLPPYCESTSCSPALQTALALVRTAVYTVLIPAIAALGIIGNVITFVVLLQPQFTSPLHTFLLVCS